MSICVIHDCMFVSCVCQSVLFMTVYLLHNYVCQSVLLMIVCLHHNYVCQSVDGFCSKCLSGCSFDLHVTSSVNTDAVGVFVCPCLLTCLPCDALSLFGEMIFCLFDCVLFVSRETYRDDDDDDDDDDILLLKSNDLRERYILNTE